MVRPISFFFLRHCRLHIDLSSRISSPTIPSPLVSNVASLDIYTKNPPDPNISTCCLVIRTLRTRRRMRGAFGILQCVFYLGLFISSEIHPFIVLFHPPTTLIIFFSSTRANRITRACHIYVLRTRNILSSTTILSATTTQSFQITRPISYSSTLAPLPSSRKVTHAPLWGGCTMERSETIP